MTAVEPTVGSERSVLTGGKPIDEREGDLTAGADRLSTNRRSITGNRHFLLTVAASLMTMGVTAIVLGWVGASRSTLIEEQVPYLISGGLLGVALAVVGALLLFTHWLTVSVREARLHEAARRQDHAELLEALRALAPLLAPQENSNGRARSTKSERPLRRAPRGS